MMDDDFSKWLLNTHINNKKIKYILLSQQHLRKFDHHMYKEINTYPIKQNVGRLEVSIDDRLFRCMQES